MGAEWSNRNCRTMPKEEHGGAPRGNRDSRSGAQARADGSARGSRFASDRTALRSKCARLPGLY